MAAVTAHNLLVANRGPVHRRQEKVMIQLVTVKQLIDRDFRQELEYVRMIGGIAL